jgi:hypothetical protein
MRCAILIQTAARIHAACVPLRPGRVATGVMFEEVGQQTYEAIAFHIQRFGEDGLALRRRHPCPGHIRPISV